MEKMQEAYDFNAVKNAEIRSRWIRLGLRSRWEDMIPNTVQMITEHGRIAYLEPIYR